MEFLSSFLKMSHPAPRATLFPYTTLFRSHREENSFIGVHNLAGRARFVIVRDRKSTRLNSSHLVISYAVFCLKKKRAGAGQSTAATHKGVFVVAFKVMSHSG